MTQRIAVYNRASAPLGLDLSAFVGALNEYVSAHLGPVWGVSAELHATDRPVPGEWSMVFLDRADVAGALAYHDEEGAPVAKVFVENEQIEVVQVEGHTDSTGGADINRKLSQARAESGLKYLIVGSLGSVSATISLPSRLSLTHRFVNRSVRRQNSLMCQAI